MKEYVRARIRASFPNTDTSDNSPIVDLIATPIGDIASEIAEFGTEVEIRHNLANYGLMSESDLDEIGEGNYMIVRRSGSKAAGTVTFKFASVSDVQDMVIPSGLIVSTKTGLEFIVLSAHSFTPVEMYEKWNSASLTYEVEIPVEAAEVGEVYNVSAGQITVLGSTFTNHITTISNNMAMSGGIDKESNADYGARILKFISSRNLETAPGYEQDIKENFQEVTGVYVAGYLDPLMTRDLADSITVGGVTFLDRHYGGKTDIYIRGHNLETASFTVTGETNRLPLPDQSALIDVAGITVTNNRTLQTMTGVTTEVNVNDKVVVIVPDTGNQWIYGDSLTVDYSTDEDNDQIYETPKSEIYTIDQTPVSIISPLNSVTSISNLTRTGVYYNIGTGKVSAGVYTITYGDDDLEGTSRETAEFLLTEPTVDNGDSIEIVYNYNDTIKALGEHYDLEGNRIVTRDILFMEAIAKYAHIDLSIKLNEGISESSAVVSAVTSVINDFLSGVEMGKSVDESDIVHELYLNSLTSGAIDYVQLPFTTFYLSSDESAAHTPGVHQGSRLLLGSIEHPVTHTINVNYI